MKTAITLAMMILLCQAVGADYGPKDGAPSKVRPVQRRDGHIYQFKDDGHLYRDSKVFYPGKIMSFAMCDNLIAVTDLHYLYLIDLDGKVVKKFASHPDSWFDMPHWNGPYLWLSDCETVEVHGFTRIDTRTMTVAKFNVLALQVNNDDWDLDTQALNLAYSDYPPMFDTDALDDFLKARTPVHLYVYDLRTGDKRLISTSVAKEFNPKWINATTLAYDNPKVKGARVRTEVKR